MTERELITPPLNGLILPGVTRLSLLELAREWKEFKVVERQINMDEVLQLHKEQRVIGFQQNLLQASLSILKSIDSCWRSLEQELLVLCARLAVYPT